MPSEDPDITQCVAQIEVFQIPTIRTFNDNIPSFTILAAYQLRVQEYERRYGRLNEIGRYHPKDEKTSAIIHYIHFITDLDEITPQLYVQSMVDVLGWETTAQIIEFCHTYRIAQSDVKRRNKVTLFYPIFPQDYDVKDPILIRIQSRGAALLNQLWAHHRLLQCHTHHLSDFVSVPWYGQIKKQLREQFDLMSCNKIMSALPDYCIPPRLRLRNLDRCYFDFSWQELPPSQNDNDDDNNNNDIQSNNDVVEINPEMRALIAPILM